MGQGGNDVFNAPLAGTNGESPTLNPLDTITGGLGTDTLRIVGAQELTGTLESIENVVYSGDISDLQGGISPVVVIDASIVGGLQTMTFQTVTADNSGLLAIVVDNLAQGQGVGVAGVYNAAELVAVYGSTATAASFSFNNARVRDGEPINGIAAFADGSKLNTINLSGSTYFKDATEFTGVLAGSESTIKTVNITASAGGTLAVDLRPISLLTTVNAASSLGNTIVTLNGLNTDLTYTGGAGSDILYYDLANITINSNITAGTGFDSLRLDSGDTVSANLAIASAASATAFEGQKSLTVTGYTLINATGFEQVGINNQGGSAPFVTAIDMGQLAANSLYLMGDRFLVSRALDADTFVSGFGGNNVLTAAKLRTAGVYEGSGVINVNAQDANISITKVVTNGTSTAAATGALTTTTTGTVISETYSDFAKLVLSGEYDVTFDNSAVVTEGTTSVTFTTFNAGGAIVDASALTGNLIWTGNTNQKDLVTLGAGDDELNVIDTGAKSTYQRYDVITGFAGDDTIAVAASGDTIVKVTTTASTLALAFVDVANQLDGAIGYFKFGSSTYIYDGADDGGVANTDLAVELVGVTGPLAIASGIVSLA